MSHVFEKVSEILCEALCLEPEEVVLSARLGSDLGAESIDYLDITFRLEREFGIKIPRLELFPESIIDGNPQFYVGDKVTLAGIEEVRKKLPWADISILQKNPRLHVVSDLFTVDMVVKYIEARINYLRMACAPGVAHHT